MSASDKTISLILKDLTNVHENLLSLSEDIWDSIDHNNQEKLDEGYQFKKEFNRLLDIFEQNSSEISTLVSQFIGIKADEEAREVSKDAAENQRIIKELNKDTPHSLTEDFTYKRPYAFIFDGCAYTDTLNWSDLYTSFASCLAKKDPALLKSMADNPDYMSNQNKKYYSSSDKDVRLPRKIMNDFFIETNLSANHIVKKMMEMLNVFKIPLDNITIYLRQDRNA